MIWAAWAICSAVGLHWSLGLLATYGAWTPLWASLGASMAIAGWLGGQSGARTIGALVVAACALQWALHGTGQRWTLAWWGPVDSWPVICAVAWMAAAMYLRRAGRPVAMACVVVGAFAMTGAVYFPGAEETFLLTAEIALVAVMATALGGGDGRPVDDRGSRRGRRPWRVAYLAGARSPALVRTISAQRGGVSGRAFEAHRPPHPVD